MKSKEFLKVSVGAIVFSKAGRDRGYYFVVVSVCDEFVYLADGRFRTLSNPKKKNARHIVPIVADCVFDAESIKSASDADIRKYLTGFVKGR